MAILQGARITGSIIATTFIKANGFSGSITASNLYVLGKAGIGTTSPSTKLYISGSSSINENLPTTYIRHSFSGTIGYGLSISRNGSDTAALCLGVDSSLNAIISSNNTDLRIGKTQSSTFNEYIRVNTSGNVGIGTTSPTRKLDVNGDTNIGTNLVVGSGIYNANYYAGNSTATYFKNSVGTDTLTILQGGNVGIGTTSPAVNFEVLGASETAGTIRINGGKVNVLAVGEINSALEFAQRDLSISGIVAGKIASISEFSNGAYAGLGFYTAKQSRTPELQEAVRINYDGNVGIGTTSPSNTKLHIVGDWVSGHSTVKSQTITSFSSGGTAGYGTYDSDGTRWGYLYSYSTGTSVGSSNDSPLILETNGTEKVRITSGGNVGIGTSSPGRKLHLYGPQSVIKLSNTGTGAWSGFEWSVGNGSYTAYSGLLDDTGRYFIDIGSNGDDFTILQNGYVGIGTTSPSNKTTIDADATGVSFADNGVAQLVIRGTTDTTKRLGLGVDTTNNIGVIQAQKYGTAAYPLALNPVGGNVGIGTTSPAYTLDVSGTGRVGDVFLITTATTSDARLEIGSGRSGNGNSYLDLIGDATYTDYGLRLIRYNGGSNTTSAIAHRGTGTLYITAVEAAAISLETSNTTRMTITSGGNVGIGTTSPGAKLDVVGNILINGASNSNIAQLAFTRTDVSWGIFNETDLRFYSSNSNTTSPSTLRMTLTSTGNVGIGTTSPTNKLHVSGSSTNLPLKLEGLTSNATGYFLTVDNTTGVVYKSTGGANGTSGTSGANGSPGSPGSSGTNGTSGTSGANGNPGTSGTSGANGNAGSSGITGTSGTSGDTNIKAWIHFNGTGTPSSNASNNVSSITDNGTGDYTINFTTAFSNANYVVAGTATYQYENPGQSINNMFIAVPRRPTAQLAGSCRISTPGSDNVLYDCDYVRVLFSN